MGQAGAGARFESDFAPVARQTQRVHITAKSEYAMRALLTLAANDGGPLTAEKLAAAQSLPEKFLENILVDLRRGGLVRSQRGSEGGYRLAREASEAEATQVGLHKARRATQFSKR